MDRVVARHGAADVGPPTDPGRSSTWRRGRMVRLETRVGLGLVLVAVLGGILFAYHPSPIAVDQWILDVVGPTRNAAFTGVTSLRYPQVIVAGSVVAAAVAFPRDRLRALACLLGPPLALATCELAAKPLVGRHLGAGLSYPSGSSVGAAALAVAAVLCVPARWRPLTSVLGTAYVAWMGIAVIALQWHYPTDALGGTAYGAGVVLLVDGAAWQVGALVRGRRAVGPPSRGG